jgi:peroxiredoxin
MISSNNVPADQVSMVGRYAPDFELPGTDGAVHHLARYLDHAQAIAIVFLSSACPVTAQNLPRITALLAEFEPQGFRVIGISANDRIQVLQDDLPQMMEFAGLHGLTFPYLRDVTQDVARTFRAICTPEVFLLDREGRVCYQGLIDDSPTDPGAVTQPYLRSAVVELLQGEAVSLAATQPTGTAIFWR